MRQIFYSKLKKLSLLIIILLFILGKPLFSQNEYLNKTFVIGNQNSPHTIVPTDSGYILACHFRNAICLVDSQATIKWLKNYNVSTGWGSYTGSNSPNVLINTGNNNYFAAGIMQNAGPSANKNYSIKYSNTFDTLYLKLLLQDTITLNNYVHNSFISSDENYIFLGSSGYSGMIIRTDSNSNFIDSTLILKGNNDYNWFNSGLQMGNYYYLFGATRAYAPLYVNGFDRQDGWVVKTDMLGNEITSTAFGNPEIYDGTFTSCLKIKNNRIITATSFSIGLNPQGFSIDKPCILVYKSDLTLEKTIFFKESYTNGDTLFGRGFLHFTSQDSLSITLLGVNFEYNMNLYQLTKRIASIVRLNPNFKVLYSRNYIHHGNVFTSLNPQVITTTSDGGYIFGGYVYDNTLSPTQQAWLVKTDSLGCDGFHSCDDTTLVCQILQAPDTACKNDTAWLQVKFKGRSAPYYIYANTTLALDSVYYPYTLPLWIDTLIPYYPTTIGMQDVIISVYDPWGWNRNDTVQVYVKNCGAGYIEENWYPKKVEIFPNPASTELRVRMRAGTGNKEYSITIYNMQGEVVKLLTTKTNETVIDVNHLEQGVYGLRVTGNNLNITDRFVKL